MSAGSDTAIGRWGLNCDVNIIHNVFTFFRQIFLNNSATIGLVIGALSILALTRGFQVIQIYISTYLLELRTICIYNIIDQMIFLRLISNCSYPMQCHFCICNPWGAGEVASLASAAATAGPLTAHPPPTDTGTPPPPEYGQWQGSVSSNAFNFVGWEIRSWRGFIWRSQVTMRLSIRTTFPL